MSDSLLGDGVNDGAGIITSDNTGGVSDNTNTHSTAPEWLKSIQGVDEDLINDPSLKAITDQAALVKSYVNAQKLIGKDKVIIPAKDAPEAEWKTFFHKLGQPDNIEQYTLTKAEDSAFDDSFLESFKKAAFELNILPSQAQKLYEHLNATETAATKSFVEQAQAKHAETVEAMKKEFGEAFESKLGLAKTAVVEVGGTELQQYLKSSGLGNDPHLVKMFVKIGEMISKEDSTGTGSPRSNALSPEDAKTKYMEIMRNPNDAYHNKDAIGHKERVEEVHKIFSAMHAGKR